MAERRSSPPQSPRATSVRGGREGNGFGHPQIAQIQRARILSAMFDVVTERGGAEVTVADVVERSGISRRTFYETFSDREECFQAAFEDALAFASQRVLPAYGAHKKWQAQIRAGLLALLRFLDEEPMVGRLLIVESQSAGAKTLELRNQVLAQLAGVVDEGRAQSPNGALLPALTAEGLVGGVLAIVTRMIVHGEQEPLAKLINPLVGMIVLPYLGGAAAHKELERPQEPSPVDPSPNGPPRTRLLANPFKDKGMRLTYRTIRVLMAVAEQPAASNRAIGESAGISDQGQISKLLSRLGRLGLIENGGFGPGQGGPNAWVLTTNGRELMKSVRSHTDFNNKQ